MWPTLAPIHGIHLGLYNENLHRAHYGPIMCPYGLTHGVQVEPMDNSMDPIWVAHAGPKKQPIKNQCGNVGWGITENSKSEKCQHWCRLKTECTCIYGFKIMPVPSSSHSGPEDCQQGILGNQFKTMTHSIWTCKDKKVFEVTNISGIK